MKNCKCWIPICALLILTAQTAWMRPAKAGVQLPADFINPNVPHDVTAGTSASIQDLAIFAWREFVALNWPALDPGHTGVRGRPNPKSAFLSIRSDDNGNFPLLVWETYRHKDELFPANGKTDSSFDSKVPTYDYRGRSLIPVDGASFKLFNSLDETSQIGLCTMYAHKTIRIAYEAKVNRAIFDYANSHGLTKCDAKENCPVLKADLDKTKGDLARYGGICSSDPSIISLPCGDASVTGDAGEGAIEIKAAWRKLTSAEAQSGRFYTRKVIYYTGQQYGKEGKEYYHNAVYGLVALHIIHKTKSFPDFVFATWEQVDDFDDAHNKNSEDLRFVNTNKSIPNIPVTRDHKISASIQSVNNAVHAAFMAKDPHTIWQYYRLVGVQATPVNGPPPNTAPPSTRSYYYLANIVVETNQTLQNFAGGQATDGRVKPFLNVYLNGAAGSPFQMGGCQGCHGAQGQAKGGNMSVLIAGGPKNASSAPEPIDDSMAASIRSYLLRSKGASKR